MKSRTTKYIKRVKVKKFFSTLKLVSETPFINIDGVLTKSARYARAK